MLFVICIIVAYAGTCQAAPHENRTKPCSLPRELTCCAGQEAQTHLDSHGATGTARTALVSTTSRLFYYSIKNDIVSKHFIKKKLRYDQYVFFYDLAQIFCSYFHLPFL